MAHEVVIEQLDTIGEHGDELAELLIRVVDEGASIGFLPPLSLADSMNYWESVPSSEVVLLVARINNLIVGSAQLHLCMKPNGSHRAEIAKVMTHPDYRRNGIGRALMLQAEQAAKQAGRSLLVLDTREGDPSNQLYASLGYVQAGRIPNYAKSADGSLSAKIFYYKMLEKGIVD